MATDEERIEVQFTKHGDYYVLIMSPYIAEVMSELAGQISGYNITKIRKATDAVWKAMSSVRPEPEDYIFYGDIKIKNEED